MKRHALAVLAALPALAALPSPALAQSASAGEQAAVLAAHDRRIAATLAGDLAGLGAMMTDDLTYTHSSAVTETKAQFLDALKSGKYGYKEIKPGERRVRIWGDTAAVSGPAHVVLEPGGKRTEIDLVYTELYVKEGGRWKMALWQSTRVPTPAAAPAR